MLEDAIKLALTKSISLYETIARINRTVKYAPKIFGVVTTYKCTQSCSNCCLYCDPEDNTKISDDVLNAYIEFAAKSAGTVLGITGGEPMLFPDQVFGAVSRAKELGLYVCLTASFFGYSNPEISENMRTLKDLGIDLLRISISESHRNAFRRRDIPYHDYIAGVLESATRNHIPVRVRIIQEDDNRRRVKKIAENILFDRLNIEGIQKIPRKTATGRKNRTRVKVEVSPTILLGRARNVRRKSGSEIADYECPQMRSLHSHINVYPDGNATRCLGTERNADIGCGNAYSMSFGEIVKNLSRTPLYDARFPDRMRVAHEIMQREFPTLLPVDGPGSSCEICSPMLSHSEVKERLRTEELFAGCF